MLEYPVFPGYTRTVEYLRGKNIELYLKIDPKAVKSIRVIRYEEDDPELIEKGNFFGTSVTSMQTEEVWEKEYTGKEQISELLTCIYPSELSGWAYLSDFVERGSLPDISVQIYEADNEAAWNYNWNNGFTIKGSELPEFVKKDIGSE